MLCLNLCPEFIQKRKLVLNTLFNLVHCQDGQQFALLSHLLADICAEFEMLG